MASPLPVYQKSFPLTETITASFKLIVFCIKSCQPSPTSEWNPKFALCK